MIKESRVAGGHIAFIVQGGERWFGGISYVKNFVQAARLASETSGVHWKITLFSKRSVFHSFLQDIRPALDRVSYAGAWLFPSIYDVPWMAPVLQPCCNVLLRLMRAVGHCFLRMQKIDVLLPYTPMDGESLPAGSVNWMPDLQHKIQPQFFSAADINYRDRCIDTIRRSKQTMIVSSKTTLHDFSVHYPEGGFTTAVLPFRVAPRLFDTADTPLLLQRHYGLPDTFFFIANQLWQHKNHMAVLEALKVLQDRGVHPTVVCSGSLEDYRNADYARSFMEKRKRYGLEERMVMLGFIPEEHKIQLMRRSCAVVQPSLCEGWSTSVEEARSLGKAMILSDIPILREQYPACEHFFDPQNPAMLADALADVWKNASPGPDEEGEHAAYAAYTGLFLQFGEQILTLMASVEHRPYAETFSRK